MKSAASLPPKSPPGHPVRFPPEDRFSDHPVPLPTRAEFEALWGPQLETATPFRFFHGELSHETLGRVGYHRVTHGFPVSDQYLPIIAAIDDYRRRILRQLKLPLSNAMRVVLDRELEATVRLGQSFASRFLAIEFEGEFLR